MTLRPSFGRGFCRAAATGLRCPAPPKGRPPVTSPFTPSTTASSPTSEFLRTDFVIFAFEPTIEWLTSALSSTEPAPIETLGPIFDFFNVTLSSM